MYFQRLKKILFCRLNSSGFSFIEILMVMSVLSVSIVIFYAVFITNWMAFQERVSRATLWSEVDQIVEQMTFDGREAMRVDVLEEEGARLAHFYDYMNQRIATYRLSVDGEIELNKDLVNEEVFETLSNHINFNDSYFSNEIGEKILFVHLALEDQVFIRNIEIETSTEIYFRN